MANENRPVTRSTLLIENIFSVEEGVSIALAGNLHGTIRRGNTLLLVHPKFPNGIAIKAEALVVDKETKEEASECRVAVMTTALKDPNEIPKYSVLTTIVPRLHPEQDKPIENPFLVGMTTEYNRLVSDNEFTYAFMCALLTSNLLTPADVAAPVETSEGKKEQKVSFKLIAHPNDPSLHVLPLFTDMAAMRQWEPLFKQNDGKVSMVALPFERSAEIALANGGLVINPFGPVGVFVSNNNVKNTLALREEVMKKQQETNQGSK